MLSMRIILSHARMLPTTPAGKRGSSMNGKTNARRPDRVQKTARKTIWITENDNNRLRNLIKGAGGFELAEGLWELETQLDRARVVGSGQIPENVVTMNCFVRLRDPDTLRECECWLRFSAEAKTPGQTVPILSNLGIALLGSKEGDTVEWTSPSGKKRSEVVEIVYQPERLGNYEL